MSQLYENDYRLTSYDATTAALMKDKVNSIVRSLDDRVGAIEDQSTSIAEMEAALSKYGTDRIEALLVPVAAAIRAVAGVGVLLSAPSQTVMVPAAGRRTLEITAAARDVFAPAAILSITADDDATASMLARRVAWDPDTGALTVDVIDAAGTGSYASWTVSAAAAVETAGQVRTAPAGGLTGSTLAQQLVEIAAALAARQPLAQTLSSLAALSLVGDRALITDATGAPAMAPVTSLGKTLLAAADAAAARAALGTVPQTSPQLLGTPTTPTASVAADSNVVCNVTMARAVAAAVVGAAPAALDTLAELASALGSDANFAGTVTTALAGKQPLAAPLTALAAAASGTSKASFRAAVGAVWGGDAPSPASAGVGLSDGDLNTITIPGLYTIGAGWSNGPGGSIATYGLLEVRRRQANNAYWQSLLIPSGARFERFSNDGATWGSWYRTGGPLLGQVSQSSGIPTGAIIERGSTVTGEYVKYADGAQTCTSVPFTADAATAEGSLYRWAAAQSWTYPAAFIAAPVVTPAAQSSALTGWGTCGSPSATSVVLSYIGTQNQTSRTVRAVATGRWY